MENGHDNTNSKGVCEKIFSCLCPTFQANQASIASNSTPSTHDHTGKVANASGGAAGATEMPQLPKAAMVRLTKVRLTRVHGERQDHTTLRRESQVGKDNMTSGNSDNNDAFSDYINRTKMKIRANMSNVGIEKVASGADYVYVTEKENDKDGFSDFVDRTKFKIRKTSSIGSKKSFSFKR